VAVEEAGHFQRLEESGHDLFQSLEMAVVREGNPYQPSVMSPIAGARAENGNSAVHEFSIATSMLDVVLAQAKRCDAATVAVVRIRIGALAGVVMEALEFAWQALTEDTIAAGSRLDVEHVSVGCFCARCRREFESRAYSYRCPVCGELSSDLRHGRELDLISIEVN
jgi:hydrogenase nickel incorporation protein HypA/HybF